MAVVNLFPDTSKPKQVKLFKWEDVRTWLVRTQYNDLLAQVITNDKEFISASTVGNKPLTSVGKIPPNYYNPNYCLALKKCSRLNTTGTGRSIIPNSKVLKLSISAPCYESDVLFDNSLMLPEFLFDRSLANGNAIAIPSKPGDTLDLTFNTSGVTVGTVMWLYYYERMGIFKILGALMDDYNYRGKFPISSKLDPASATLQPLNYSPLMDTISTLYRMGIGSNLRDRICLYQRVLGVTIENNLNVTSEKNEGFMKFFNQLVEAMLEFYKSKQLAQAIQTSATPNIRSSVATQTVIRDTVQILQKNFENLEYGRNRLNTFLGVSTVYATICLLRMLKDEIGVPRQYNDPHEFIPAAYDILVQKNNAQSDTNRFTIYDNCASYGYRLLTDIEMADTSELSTVAIGSTLDLWLNDMEGTVEGYNNAYKSISEPASAIV